MAHGFRALGVIACMLVGVQPRAAAASEAPDKPVIEGPRAAATPKKKKPPTSEAPETATRAATDPAIDIAAGLHVAAVLAKRASKSSKSDGKSPSATYARMVGALDYAARRCDEAVAEAKAGKKTKSTARVAALCRSVKDELEAARQIRKAGSAAKRSKLASSITASSAKARGLAKSAHSDSSLMISAVALRLVLAEAIDSAAKAANGGQGTNALVGEKGINGIIGEKGVNAIIGEKGVNAIIGEKGVNAIIGEKGSNAVVGKISRTLDAEIVDLALELLESVASSNALAQRAKAKAHELGGVRDAIRASRAQSVTAQKRALQAADWANEKLITDLQGP